MNEQDALALKGLDIEFGEGMSRHDGYAEPGMRARVLSVRVRTEEGDDGPSVRMDVDFGSFDQHNRRFEERNYYDRDGRPTLTAREAGYYREKDTLWLSLSEMAECLRPLDPRMSLMRERWKESGGGLDFEQWLFERACAAELGDRPEPPAP